LKKNHGFILKDKARTSQRAHFKNESFLDCILQDRKNDLKPKKIYYQYTSRYMLFQIYFKHFLRFLSRFNFFFNNINKFAVFLYYLIIISVNLLSFDHLIHDHIRYNVMSHLVTVTKHLSEITYNDL